MGKGRPSGKRIGERCKEKGCGSNSYIRQVRQVLHNSKEWLTTEEIREALPQRYRGTINQINQYLRYWFAHGLIKRRKARGVKRHPIYVYYWEKGLE